MLEYEYLLGLLLFPLPLFLFLYRKRQNRAAMVHSGLFFTILLTLCFLAGKTRQIPENLSFAPGYWHPKTLFDLEVITGGISIESLVFIFLTGGIAAVCVEFVLGEKVKTGIIRHHHFLAFLFAAFASYLFYKATYLNLIWVLIAFNVAGALYLVVVRKDLRKHVLLGGAVFGLIYFFLFALFNLLFKDFVELNYNIPNLLGIFIAGIPLEEILFGISLGMFWSPEIEYEYGIRSKV